MYVATSSDKLVSDSTHYGRRWKGKHYPHKYYYVEGRKAELFPFDPNTADSTQLLRLGLKPWQVRNIYKYRAKGGIYRTPSDFARLYGLTQKQYRDMEPYITIGDDFRPAFELLSEEERKAHERDTVKYPVKLEKGTVIDLNKADTAVLRKVPGIGIAYARTIIAYRERLGGFVSVEQLNDLEEIPAESKEYLRVGDTSVRKINLNKATLSELQHHPYISYSQARAIADYRRLKGRITSLSQLSLHREFTPEAIHRIEPYVEY